MTAHSNQDEITRCRKRLMANEITVEALIELLVEKGVFGREELLDRFKGSRTVGCSMADRGH